MDVEKLQAWKHPADVRLAELCRQAAQGIRKGTHVSDMLVLFASDFGAKGVMLVVRLQTNLSEEPSNLCKRRDDWSCHVRVRSGLAVAKADYMVCVCGIFRDLYLYFGGEVEQPEIDVDV